MAARDRVLLDTCALIWFASGNSRFTAENVSYVLDAAEEDRLFVSVASLWELGYLERKGRLQLEVPYKVFWELAKTKINIKSIPITESIIHQFHALEQTLHNDPGDRFIVGTALQQRCTLVTGDLKLITWAEQSKHAHRAL